MLHIVLYTSSNTAPPDSLAHLSSRRSAHPGRMVGKHLLPWAMTPPSHHTEPEPIFAQRKCQRRSSWGWALTGVNATLSHSCHDTVRGATSQRSLGISLFLSHFSLVSWNNNKKYSHKLNQIWGKKSTKLSRTSKGISWSFWQGRLWFYIHLDTRCFFFQILIDH